MDLRYEAVDFYWYLTYFRSDQPIARNETSVNVTPALTPVPATPATSSLKRSAEKLLAPATSKKTKGNALEGLLSEVSGMNEAFRTFLAPPAVPTDPSLLLTPACRAKAISLVEQENDLDTDDALEFIDAMCENKVIVDTYNSFSNAALRRQFIENTVQKRRRY